MSFFLYIKTAQDSSARYYQKIKKNKERLRQKARERHQDLFEEEKNKKQQYSCEQYKNLPEDLKQRLIEHREICNMAKINCFANKG